MTNHPNRSKITQAAWLEANYNQELCELAADMAWGALKGHFQARDEAASVTHKDCVHIAEDEAYKARNGWDYAAADADDPAGELAQTVLAKLGFELRSGIIGEHDSTIAKTA